MHPLPKFVHFVNTESFKLIKDVLLNFGLQVKRFDIRLNFINFYVPQLLLVIIVCLSRATYASRDQLSVFIDAYLPDGLVVKSKTCPQISALKEVFNRSKDLRLLMCLI